MATSEEHIEPYAGYPGQANPNIDNVITSQAQLPTWPSVQFLERMKSVRLVEENPCWGLPLDILCLSWCFRRKLRIFNDGGEYLGFSESPCTCCSDEVYAHIPENSNSMEMVKRCNCGRWLAEFLCPCFFMCDDIRIKEIYDSRGTKIGSFDYSPKYCRSEPFCCCKGKYVVKRFDGQKVFYVPKLPCCACKDVLWCPTRCCGDVPLLMCTNSSIIFPMCQKWSVPVKISSTNDDDVVGYIKMINEPWCKQKFCCVPVKYDVTYDRSPESVENKALLLGTAMIMDHHGLVPRLYNDPDITYDEQSSTMVQRE